MIAKVIYYIHKVASSNESSPAKMTQFVETVL